MPVLASCIGIQVTGKESAWKSVWCGSGAVRGTNLGHLFKGDGHTPAGLWEEESKKKEKKKNVFDDVSRMFDTILYYWYGSCSVFFLNSWIIYYRVLTQLVPDVDKMHHHTLFFSLFLEPRRLVICGGAALLWWSSCDWSREFHFHGNHLLEEAGLRRTWIHPKAGSHRQPSPAVLQLSPWKEASESGLSPPPGTPRSFFNKYTFGYFHSCCTIPVADRTC